MYKLMVDIGYPEPCLFPTAQILIPTQWGGRGKNDSLKVLNYLIFSLKEQVYLLLGAFKDLDLQSLAPV